MITINKISRIATISDGKKVLLTPRYVALLLTLSKEEYQKLPQLNEKLTGTEHCDPRIAAVYINGVRKKLGADSIITSKYNGYKLASHIMFEDEVIEAVQFFNWTRAKGLNYTDNVSGIDLYSKWVDEIKKQLS